MARCTDCMPICCDLLFKTAGVLNTGFQTQIDPGRSTLQPLSILRHLKDAAQKMQRGSSRLYAAFIDFKQAFNSIPRDKLWDQLAKLLSDASTFRVHTPRLYHADEYTSDAGWGEKSKCATIFWCQTRVPPLPPPIFNLLDSLVEGVQGAITGVPILQ